MKLTDVLVGIFLGAILLYLFQPKPKPVEVPPTVITDTVWVPNNIEVIRDSLITYFIPDTSDRGKLKKAYALVDSLIAQLNHDGDYGMGYGGSYDVFMDTTIMYNLDTAFYAVTHLSQSIPFSKDLRANMNIKYRIPIVTTLTTYKPTYEETFWDKFGISLQAGVGYGWIHKQADFYTGLGVHFKLK